MAEFSIARTDSYDFVVCGGGPSGVAAAVNAARRGQKVALIEREGALGGVATLGCVGILLGGRKLNEATGEHLRVVGGFFDEVTDALIQTGGALEPNTTNLNFNPIGWYPRMASGVVFDDTALKVLLDRLCIEAGVRLYFFTQLIGADVEDRRIRAVYAANKDGIVCIQSPLFADCTGDGDLAALSGCTFQQGRPEDGLTTPASLIFHVDHVDGDAYVRYQNKHNSPKLVEIIERLKAEGEWPYPYEIFIAIQSVEKDVFHINTIRQTGVNGVSEASVSRALAQGRHEDLELFALMQKHFPGFQNARLRRVSDHLGIRETRRIRGLYTIALQDALEGRTYPDTVAATTYNFDLPDPLKPSYDPMMGSAKTPNAQRRHVVIRIPYRSLLPAGVDNLILAGRCVSCEREVLGPVRIMGPCMQTGQAAGTAAALCLKGGCTFKTLDPELLRRALWADGVLDPDSLPFD